MMLSAVALATLLTVPQSAATISACDLLRSPEEYAGKAIEIRDRIVGGPHELLVVVRGCRDGARADTQHIVVELNLPKKLQKKMLRRLESGEEIQGKLRGRIVVARNEGFGFISARVMLRVTEIEEEVKKMQK